MHARTHARTHARSNTSTAWVVLIRTSLRTGPHLSHCSSPLPRPPSSPPDERIYVDAKDLVLRNNDDGEVSLSSLATQNKDLTAQVTTMAAEMVEMKAALVQAQNISFDEFATNDALDLAINAAASGA